VVASFDVTPYLQAVSPPAWISNGRCSLVHSHSSASLRRTVAPAVQLQHSPSHPVLPLPRDDVIHRSRDTADAASSDSGFSSDSSSEEVTSVVTSSVTWSRSSHKHVWFADDVGLDLVTIRRYELSPAAPDPAPPVKRPSFRRRVRLEPGFRQPWLDPAGLQARLDRDSVALESVSSRAGGLSFAGTVLVSNVAYEKRVTVRCTFDFWRSFTDVAAVYVTSGCPGTDLFSFEVQSDVATTGCDESSPRRGRGRFEFALRYQYRDHCDDAWTERWDNNQARNYQLLATC